MQRALVDHDLLTELTREVCEWAAQLNPGADHEDLLNMGMAAAGALVPGAPDAWLEAAVERAAEQLRWH